ncbi:hypothetical protein N9D59_05510 [Burkholderiaceae bacterium]|nr:hypothetical protein [Burkholderiaceae bacterium]
MKNFSLLVFLMILQALGAGPLHAQSDVPTRPLTVFIKDSPDAEVQQLNVVFSLGNSRDSPLGPMFIENDRGQTICTGVLGSRRHNWLFRDFKCAFSDEEFSEILLVQKSSWGVINHGVALLSFKSGVTMGLLLHVGSEQVVLSTSKVDMDDVEELYGTFPKWNLPSN